MRVTKRRMVTYGRMVREEGVFFSAIMRLHEYNSSEGFITTGRSKVLVLKFIGVNILTILD